jgi:copper oxidase (laccase) domain-containing protein
VVRNDVVLGDGRVLHWVFTNGGDGDFRVVDPVAGLEDRRRAVVDRPWSWLHQVHGAQVWPVDHAGHRAGDEGDGLVTTVSDAPLSVTTADCGPLVLVAEAGVAVVHAGWRGLMAGVIEEAASILARVGGRPAAAHLGPTIGPAAYRFGADDLARVAERYGDEVVARTATGEPALNMPAAVASACRAAGWPAPGRPSCTSDPRWFSHRTRSDQGRQAAVAWIADGPADG